MHSVFQTIVMLGITYGIYKLFDLFVRRKERMAIIEKFSVGECMLTPPDVTKWFPSPAPKFGALRIGLLLIGVGLGMCVGAYMNSYLDIEMRKAQVFFDHGEVFYLASMMFFGGLALVIAYLIEQKNCKKE